MAVDHPWFGILLTISVWAAASALNKRAQTPLLDPVLMTVVVIVAALMLLDIPYEAYNVGGSVISFLLGPAVVALAVPFCRHLARVREHLLPLIISVFIGAVAGIVSASGLVFLFGGSMGSVVSVAPKSVTTPIAMEISSIIGGTPPLTIAVVVLTGILGGMIGPRVLGWVGITAPMAAGLAIGTASHGIGTSRALREDEVMGAMSGVGMVVNGLITASLLPLAAWRFL